MRKAITLGVVGSLAVASLAHAAVITVPLTDAVGINDNSITDLVGDNAAVINAGANFQPGRRVATTGTNYVRRDVLLFSLANLPAGSTITSVVLNARLSSVTSNLPNGSLQVYGANAVNAIDPSTSYNNATNRGFYDSGSFGLIGNIATTSTAPGTVSLDVTSTVLAEYSGIVATDGAVAFRWQVSGDGSGISLPAASSTNTRRYVLDRQATSPNPELVITYVPEPGAAALAGAAAIGLLRRRSRR
jgi:hypothetical protein